MSEENKRKREDTNEGEGDAAKQVKRQKTKPAYTFNMNFALDKEMETKSFKEIITMHPSALQGIGEVANEMLEAMHIKTIEALANWKYYKIACAIETLAATEEDGKRSPDGESNLNHALDKEWETKTFKEMLEAPCHILQGLADWTDTVLKKLHVKTIKDLADFKYAKWAESFVTLAKFENPDHSSK